MEVATISAFSETGFSDPKYATELPQALANAGLNQDSWSKFIANANEAVKFEWGLERFVVSCPTLIIKKWQATWKYFATIIKPYSQVDYRYRTRWSQRSKLFSSRIVQEVQEHLKRFTNSFSQEHECDGV
jgi:hypothetical protein